MKSTIRQVRRDTHVPDTMDAPSRKTLVAVAPGSPSGSLVLNDLLPPPDGMTVVDLDNRRHVFASGQRSGCSPSTRRQAGVGAMLIVRPARKSIGIYRHVQSFDGFAALVLKHLEKDPFSGHLKLDGIYETHTTPKSHFGAVMLASPARFWRYNHLLLGPGRPFRLFRSESLNSA
jgi:hypothetical protein